jgi:hypothetical protein
MMPSGKDDAELQGRKLSSRKPQAVEPQAVEPQAARTVSAKPIVPARIAGRVTSSSQS